MSAPSMPLRCCICPKKQSFSDISHLLTHVASKGHLSHYYKVKVRSASDASSRTLVSEYDRWYSNWRVEHLISERMYLKDSRKPRARATVRRVKRQHLDPRLEEPRSAILRTIKKEPSVTPAPDDKAFLHRSFVPRMHLWSTSRGSPCRSVGSEVEGSGAPTVNNDRKHSGDLAMLDVQYAEAECTKLKGVIWPGMDIFDAATPETRRKRNQKKDISVVERLQVSSLEVTPTEMVFTPDGSLKKQKRISGQVDLDSSPFKDFCPSPRMRRPVLAERDANSNLIPQRRYSKPPAKAHRSAKQLNDLPEARHSRLGEKRKKDFTVFDDRPDFGHPAGFTHLNSGVWFAPQPADHAPDQKPSRMPTMDSRDEYHSFTSAACHFPTNLLHPQLVHNMPHWNPFDPFGPFGNDMPSFFPNQSSAFYRSFDTHEHYGQDGCHDDEDDDRTISAPASEA